MSDGRQIIDEVYRVVKGISEKMETKKSIYPDDVFASTTQDVEASLTWAKKCRNKVWLRSKEGTDLAAGCLNAANGLKEKLDDTSSAPGAASELLIKLETLAKIIATKASVMT